MCKAALMLALLSVAPSDQDVIQEYEHRQQIVTGEFARRREHLQKRLLALYKLQRGGYARMLVEAPTRAEFFARRAAASRIVERDLAELRLYAREQKALEAEKQRLQTAASAMMPVDLPIVLRLPVAHAEVVAHFGPYHDAVSGLELERRGVLLGAHPGEIVRAPASGIVRFAGALDELGQTAVIEHDGGFYTVLGKMRELRVLEDVRVAQGDELGVAGGPILLQLRRGTTALDPEPLLRHTGR